MKIDGYQIVHETLASQALRNFRNAEKNRVAVGKYVLGSGRSNLVKAANNAIKQRSDKAEQIAKKHGHELYSWSGNKVTSKNEPMIKAHNRHMDAVDLKKYAEIGKS